MASAIDTTKPVFGSPTTASVRANFAAAKSEIEALQLATSLTVAQSSAGDPTVVTLPGVIGDNVSADLFTYTPDTSYIIVKVLVQATNVDVNYDVELFDDAVLVYQATGIAATSDYKDNTILFIDELTGTKLTVKFTNNTAVESDMYIAVKYVALADSN